MTLIVPPAMGFLVCAFYATSSGCEARIARCQRISRLGIKCARAATGPTGSSRASIGVTYDI